MKAERRAWKWPRRCRLIAGAPENADQAAARTFHQGADQRVRAANGPKPDKARFSRTTGIRTIHGSDADPSLTHGAGHGPVLPRGVRHPARGVGIGCRALSGGAKHSCHQANSNLGSITPEDKLKRAFSAEGDQPNELTADGAGHGHVMALDDMVAFGASMSMKFLINLPNRSRHSPHTTLGFSSGLDKSAPAILEELPHLSGEA